jgi:DNA uptake protein ComE-like DNA-binding protein
MQIDPEFKDQLTKYFTFSRREYKASLALLIITLGTWFFADIKSYFFPAKFDDALIRQKALELDAIIESKNDEKETADEKNYGYHQNSGIENPSATQYFNFDPNCTSDEDFKKLGFSPRQIHIIKNYLSKIGRIKSKADFKKIYGIPESQFEALEPFINLPATRTEENHYSTERIPVIKIINIELNSADSIELDKLPGIGMGYARRIIKYRNSLGGFEDVSQLMEVYGFRQTLLDTISPFISLDPSKIIRLDLNHADLEELKKHPYLRYKIANAIVNYRDQHGNFTSIDDIRNIQLITDDLYLKLKTYLKID